MNFKIYICPLILLIMMLHSCLEVPVDSVTPANKSFSVSGLLQNNTTVQKIFLYRGSFIDSIQIEQKLSVSEADVTLTGKKNSFVFHESDSIQGMYVLRNWRPQGNTKYALSIQHDDYATVTGETTFPDYGPFNPSFHFDQSGNLLLSWDDITNAYGYFIDIYLWRYGYRNGFEEKEHYWGGEIYKKTTFTSIKIDKKFLIFRNTEVDIKVIISAIDRNYYAYLKFDDAYDPLDFHLIDYGNFSVVDNGLGFIGSAYADSLIIERD
ncbi:MAG: DUF4249 family protein [Caldithrix sp.]|nr:DUF4249 family protein [Caldithrix sp.]